MSKRGAQFQMSKDGAFNGDGSDPSMTSSAPQRATAAQMAKRKIAQARSIRGGSRPTSANDPSRAISNPFKSLDPNAVNGSSAAAASTTPFAQQPNGNGFSLTNGGSNPAGFQFGAANNAAPNQSSGSSGFNFNMGGTSAFSFGSGGGGGTSATTGNPMQSSGGYSGSLFNIPSSDAKPSANQSAPAGPGDAAPLWASHSPHLQGSSQAAASSPASGPPAASNPFAQSAVNGIGQASSASQLTFSFGQSASNSTPAKPQSSSSLFSFGQPATSANSSQASSTPSVGQSFSAGAPFGSKPDSNASASKPAFSFSSPTTTPSGASNVFGNSAQPNAASNPFTKAAPPATTTSDPPTSATQPATPNVPQSSNDTSMTSPESQRTASHQTSDASGATPAPQPQASPTPAGQSKPPLFSFGAPSATSSPEAATKGPTATPQPKSLFSFGQPAASPSATATTSAPSTTSITPSAPSAPAFTFSQPGKPANEPKKSLFSFSQPASASTPNLAASAPESKAAQSAQLPSSSSLFPITSSKAPADASSPVSAPVSQSATTTSLFPNSITPPTTSDVSSLFAGAKRPSAPDATSLLPNSSATSSSSPAPVNLFASAAAKVSESPSDTPSQPTASKEKVPSLFSFSQPPTTAPTSKSLFSFATPASTSVADPSPSTVQDAALAASNTVPGPPFSDAGSPAFGKEASQATRQKPAQSQSNQNWAAPVQSGSSLFSTPQAQQTKPSAGSEHQPPATVGPHGLARQPLFPAPATTGKPVSGGVFASVPSDNATRGLKSPEHAASTFGSFDQVQITQAKAREFFAGRLSLLSPPGDLLISRLKGKQREQFIFAWRAEFIERGYREYLAQPHADSHRAFTVFEALASVNFNMAGGLLAKRSHEQTGLDPENTTSNKRLRSELAPTSTNAPTSLFGAPAAATANSAIDPKMPSAFGAGKPDGVSYPPISKQQTEGSRTSQVFASFLSPEKSMEAAPQSGFSPSPSAAFGQQNLAPAMTQNGSSELASTSNAKTLFGFSTLNSTGKPTAGSASTYSTPKVTAAPANDFMAQFGQAAQKTAEAEKERRKAEDYDSDEETEEQWEKRYDEEQARKKEQSRQTSSGPGFQIKASSSGATAAMPKFSAPSTAPNSFVAQFGQAAQATAEAEKAKRKAEDYDSDEETEEQWEKRYEEEQRRKRQQLQEAAKGPGFKLQAAKDDAPTKDSAATIFSAAPTPSGSSSTSNLFARLSRTDADKENQSPSQVDSDDANRSSSENDGPPAPAVAPGRSIFDRIEMDDQGRPRRDTSEPAEEEARKRAEFEKLLPAKFRSGSVEPLSQTSSQASRSPSPAVSSSSLFGTGSGALKPKTNIFDTASTGSASLFAPQSASSASQSQVASADKGDHTWNPGTPIKFGTSVAEPGPALNVTAPTPTKSSNSAGLFDFKNGTSSSASSLFSAKAPALPTSSGSVLDNAQRNAPMAASSNPFAHLTNGTSSTSQASNPFASLSQTMTSGDTPSNPFAQLSQGSSGPGSLGSVFALAGKGSTLSPSILGSGATSRATTPGATTGEESTAEEGNTAATSPEDDAAPAEAQLDLSKSNAGEEQEDVLFEARAKASEYASAGAGADKDDKESGSSDKTWKVRGLGPLRVLRTRSDDGQGRVRVVMRADPSAKILINTGLFRAMPYGLANAKMVNLPVVSGDGSMQRWMIQVKDAADATRLSDLLQAEKTKAQ